MPALQTLSGLARAAWMRRGWLLWWERQECVSGKASQKRQLSSCVLKDEEVTGRRTGWEAVPGGGQRRGEGAAWGGQVGERGASERWQAVPGTGGGCWAGEEGTEIDGASGAGGGWVRRGSCSPYEGF